MKSQKSEIALVKFDFMSILSDNVSFYTYFLFFFFLLGGLTENRTYAKGVVPCNNIGMRFFQEIPNFRKY